MRRMLVGALCVVALCLSGCASAVGAVDPAPTPSLAALEELSAASDPHDLTGVSAAVLPDAAVTPVTDDPRQTLPVTAVSHDREGDIEQRVTDTSRIVAIDLAGSLAATVWGLGFGDSLVGRDQSTSFPGTEDLPLVTSGGHTVNVESVIALKPTLVITDGTVGPLDVITQLRDVGIPVVFVDNEPSFAGAADLARQVADVLGAPDAGEQLAARITAEVDQTVAAIDALAADDDPLRMVFLYLRGSAGVYYLFGDESGADALIDALDGVDVAGEQGWEGMQPMTDEALIAANPDLILVMTGGLESVGGVDGLLAEKPAIALTTAGQKHRFVHMADGAILSFGPRSAQVLDALARAVYAPQETE